MEQFDPEKSPTALFCALETAIRRGDFERAAKLKNKLKALGYAVSVKLRPREARA